MARLDRLAANRGATSASDAPMICRHARQLDQSAGRVVRWLQADRACPNVQRTLVIFRQERNKDMVEHHVGLRGFLREVMADFCR